MRHYQARVERPTGAVMVFGFAAGAKEDPRLLAMLRLGMLGLGAQIQVEALKRSSQRRRQRDEV
jgi:hypothetical protein